jgi:UDP-glucose-4-epimerase GalE
MKVLVTGGAGFVGSHFVHYAKRAGIALLVVDDLRAGHRDAIPADVPLFAFAVEDRAQMRALLARETPTTVVHFAGSIDVAESVRRPGYYFENNVACTNHMLSACAEAGVSSFLFSSSAAVYGDPAGGSLEPLQESAACAPTSAYGESKLQTERMLPHFARAHGLRSVALRYFNAAGAEPAWGLAERHQPETHLIPLAIDAARGVRPLLRVFGTDYPTPDGTALRDYVHVIDLARAHVAALQYLAAGGASDTFNVGAGLGSSVQDVLAAVAIAAGKPVPHERTARRAGDPPALIAATAKIARVLGFRCERSALAAIVQDAWISRT